jgi:membrane protease YdiL (CAAX protease family)
MSTIASGRHITSAGVPARLDLPRRVAITLLCLIAACAVSLLIALANQPYFDLLNSLVGARETVARAVVFSSWLIVIGGALVIWRPSAFGIGFADTARHWRLILGALVAAAAATLVVLRVFGSTPYSEASLFVETVVVPITEELVFRGVLLTALLAVLLRFHGRGTAIVLAIAIDGAAFGVAHLANATSIAGTFVLGQAMFAAFLGAGCASLMAKTRSVIPAILLHAVVNAVVVLAS